jgi:predicted nuclease of predicted toxin-antitoxin system
LRILIDESLPIELADELQGHAVSTVRQRRWHGLRNGVLLRAAVDAGFRVIITADQSLPHQQNLAKIGIAAVVIRRTRTRMRYLLPLIPKILAAIDEVEIGKVIEVRPR